MGLKVLVVSDFTTSRCGIAAFGKDLVDALRGCYGVEVGTWDGYYPLIYARREACQPAYLPDDAASYDVILVNWHPGTFNHYGAGHFPPGPILSAYWHDIPPWSRCPYEEAVDVAFTSEPYEYMHKSGEVRKSNVLNYPCLDYCPPTLWAPGNPVVIGWSGIRNDGKSEVEVVCQELGWEPNLPSPVWLSPEEEIDRLAKSTVNVFLYQAGRGKSGAVMRAVSALRPILINTSPMFSNVASYTKDFYIASGDLKADLVGIVAEAKHGVERMPLRCRRDNLWSKAAVHMRDLWLAAKEKRSET